MDADVDTLFATRACTYQQHQGKKLSDRFDAYSYWYLANSLDSHNLGRGRGGISKALSMIKADVTVVAIDRDNVFPPCDLKAMAGEIENAKYYEITSLFGHDGFLLENDQIGAILKPLLND